MKNLVTAFFLFLCLTLVFSVAGCGSVPPGIPTGITGTTSGNDTTPTFIWYAPIHAGSGIDYYLVSVDGGEWMNVGNVTTYTLNSALSDGSHTFRVKAVDKAGNEGDEGSSTFTCDTTPPSISSVTASSMTTSSALITWTTDKTSTSEVEYGTTASYGSSSPLNSSLVASHSVALPGLTSGTTYHYRVKSKDAAGNEATSGDYTFGTEGVEVIPTNHLVLTMTHDDASPGYYNGNVVDIRFTDNMRFTLDDKFGTFSGDYSYGGGKLKLDFDSYPAWTMTFTDATNFTGTEAGYADTGTYLWE